MDPFKAPEMPKVIKRKRVMIPLDDELFERLAQMAWQYQVSMSFLGSMAIVRLLQASLDGSFSLVPEFQPDREIPRA